MASSSMRWILALAMVIPSLSADAQRMPAERLSPLILESSNFGTSTQDNPLGRLVRWPVDCRHGQGIAFVSGALAGAVTGWFVYHFVAMGVFAPDSPSKRDATRTSMIAGAGVVGLYSMYQWHRQCASEPDDVSGYTRTR